MNLTNTQFLLVLIVTFFSPLYLSAGDFLGNGGGGLSCPGQPFELLDFYEAKKMGGIPPNLGVENAEAFSLSQVYLQRLGQHSPIRAKIYRQWFDLFYEEATFVEQLPLNEIPDLGVEIPPQCVWHQIINQNSLLLAPGKRYLIDTNLWSALSTLQKVGLIFHELIYRESKSTTSRGVRHLNALIASHQLNQRSLESRIQLFTNAGLPWMEAQGLQFHLNSHLVVKNNIILKATPIENSTFTWQGQVLTLFSDDVEFHSTGTIKSLRTKSPLYLNLNNQVFEFTSLLYDKNKIYFHENGAFHRGHLMHGRFKTSLYNLSYLEIGLNPIGQMIFVDDAQGHVQVNGQNISIIPSSLVFFYPQSTKIKTFIWGTSKALTLYNKYKIYPAYKSTVTLNPQGELLEFVSERAGEIITPQGVMLKFQPGDRVRLDQ